MPNDKFEVGLVFKAFDKVTGPLKLINSRLNAFQAPLRRLNNAFVGFAQASGLNRIGDSFLKIGAAARSVGSEVFSLGKKFLIFGGIAAAVVGSAIKRTVDWASDIDDLSAATGASVESIQRLGFALGQSGGDSESFEAGLKKFTAALATAKKGAGPLAEVMKKIDPKGLKQILAAKDTGEGLRLFVESLSKAKDDPARFAASMKVFGKSAAQAFSVLSGEGPEKLKKVMDSINVFGPDQLAETNNLGDTYEQVMEQVNRSWMAFVIESAPALNDLLKDLSKWLVDNKDEIKAWAKDFGEKLPGRLKAIKKGFEDLWAKLKPVREFFNWITEDSDRMAIALGVVAAIMAGPLLAAIAMLMASLIGLAAAFLGTPFGWFALGIAGTILILSDMYDQVESVIKLLGGMFDDAIANAETFKKILMAINDFTTGGPLIRFLTGKDSKFDPLKKFRDIDMPSDPGKNTREAWNSGLEKSKERAEAFKSLWEGTKSLKKFITDPTPATTAPGMGPQQPYNIQEILNKLKVQQAPPAKLEPQVIKDNSQITVRFENLPQGATASVTRGDGSRLKVDMPMGVQAGRRSA